MEPGVSILICPIVALVADQVTILRASGINTCYVTHQLCDAEKQVIYRHLCSPDPGYEIICTTPETVLSPEMTRTLVKLQGQGKLQRFIIDEAHCIDLWGNDFRESYTQLGTLKDFGVPVIALKGSATQTTKDVILDTLKIPNAKVVSNSLNRPKICYTVEPKGQKVIDDIVQLINSKFQGLSSIVYCSEVRYTKNVAYNLNVSGISAGHYYANLDPFEKQSVETGWMEGRIKVICATIAFGMGIDKKDCRFVIHHTMSQNVEGFSQESGRAGRDGQPAHSILFYRFEDRTGLSLSF
ncbi:putative ATP-dependent DNA helicase Q1 [Montipora foliosa]|uniref:putative ATP-dependent DNA helicase Q1 n=1 Tax=Montipora foliosa TaxID=591990 RepID=UPI0035F1517E